ncbi:hypothetical protein BZG36_01114 [Bifiguratus adelaidae]|uniref:FAD-binding domain-containing protein n=1 Tax=Bifiguratus adelaidae TaxID=1938954 RepID=A0A261Y656_9FUNG|nr:hypothetical protein BZG36_01114 [Bifiguratus adelaidae]
MAIVGGGLGGLMCAQALAKANPQLKVIVYERSSAPSAESRPQGWHLGIQSMGINALRTVDIPRMDDLLCASVSSAFTICDHDANVLLRIGGPLKAEVREDREARFTGKMSACIVNRQDLHELLSQGVHIEYEKRFTKYEEEDDKVKLFFEDGSSAEADFLVGADGARSRMRGQLLPQITYGPVGVVNMGVVIENVPPLDDLPMLGPMLAYSMVRLLSNSGYSMLLGLAKTLEGKHQLLYVLTGPKDMFPDELQPDKATTAPVNDSSMTERLIAWAIETVSKHFHPEVAKITALVKSENLIFGGLLPSQSSSGLEKGNPFMQVKHKRVTLLGDAAHAMTTHRGMGANTSLADAVDLSQCLASPNWAQELPKYEAIMYKRGWKNVKGSLDNTLRMHKKNAESFSSRLSMRAAGVIMTLLGYSWS